MGGPDWALQAGPGGECRVFIGGGWWLGGPRRPVPPSLEGDLEDVGAAGGGAAVGGVPRGEARANPERLGFGHKVTGQRGDVRSCQFGLA